MIDVTEVARKLIGPVTPVGETNADEQRLENLNAMIEVVDYLLSDIREAAASRNRVEASVKAIGRRANSALMDWGAEQAERER